MTPRKPPLLGAEAHPPSLSYMPQLDGLRALAVGMVIVYHLLQPIQTGGWVGVHVFFVLSGYLITCLLLHDLHRFKRVRLRRFYALRLLRLYPPLLIALVALAPLGLATAPSGRQYVIHNVVAALYLTNLFITITGDFIGGWSHTWTLALEEQFYLVWPLGLVMLFRFLPRSRVALWLIGVISAISIVGFVLTYTPQGAYFNPLWTCGGLLLGCLMAITRSRWTNIARRTAAGGAAIALLGFAWTIGLFSWAGAAPGVLAIFGSGVLVAHLASGGPLAAPFAVRPAVHVGQISYELYLWHYPLLIAADDLLPDSRSSVILLVVPLTVIAAEVSHRYLTTRLSAWARPRLEQRYAMAP